MAISIPESIQPPILTPSAAKRQPNALKPVDLALSQPPPQPPLAANWQAAMAAAITRPADLLQRLDLPMSLLPAAESAARLFPLRVPLPYLALIRPGDPNDPLLRQVLPLPQEHIEHPRFAADPVGDLDAMVAPGLLHKYRGRALLVTTGACAVHCRYCFRRHFPYQAENCGHAAQRDALAAIAADSSISEVILSGGDPLSLSDTRLAALVAELEQIPHLRRLRLHSRTAVVLPQRINAALCDWLSSSRLQRVVVVHVNHPRELGAEMRAALARLAATGATLLNQSVLLAGVNDEVETLAELSEALFDGGVLPYYLHQLDAVAGASHFEVARPRALALHRQLAGQLPGYLLPRLVHEQAGADSKLAVV